MFKKEPQYLKVINVEIISTGKSSILIFLNISYEIYVISKDYHGVVTLIITFIFVYRLM